MRGLVILAACALGAGEAAGAGANAAPVPVAPSIATPADCGDVLAQMHRKPAHLAYVGCRVLPDRQGRPLHATYRVAGRYAAAVEGALARTAKLERLRRSCCRWDAPPAGFVAAGRAYTLTMTSTDTTVATRAGWAAVPSFEVTVESPTEEI